MSKLMVLLITLGGACICFGLASMAAGFHFGVGSSIAAGITALILYAKETFDDR